MSRRQLFEAVEHPVMRALLQDDFEFAELYFARVGIDYHAKVQGLFYLVPHALIREQVDTRATQRTIEVFHRGKRVAAHARRYGGARHGTQPEHVPSAHRLYAEWTPDRLQRDARASARHGSDGHRRDGAQAASRAGFPHLHGYLAAVPRSRCRLSGGRQPTRSRNRRAALRPVASILKHWIDRMAPPQAADDAPLLHDNIRGSGHYLLSFASFKDRKSTATALKEAAARAAFAILEGHHPSIGKHLNIVNRRRPQTCLERLRWTMRDGTTFYIDSSVTLLSRHVNKFANV